MGTCDLILIFTGSGGRARTYLTPTDYQRIARLDALIDALESGAVELDEDLDTVIHRWARLPADVRRGLVAMVGAVARSSPDAQPHSSFDSP